MNPEKVCGKSGARYVSFIVPYTPPPPRWYEIRKKYKMQNRASGGRCAIIRLRYSAAGFFCITNLNSHTQPIAAKNITAG